MKIKHYFLYTLLLWVQVAFGQNLKDHLHSCVEQYRNHTNYFMATDTKRNPELDLTAKFDKLFLAGAYLEHCFPQQQPNLTPIQYGLALASMTDNAELTFEQIFYCRHDSKPDVFYVHVRQRFKGKYLLNSQPIPLPAQNLTITILKKGGEFFIASVKIREQIWTNIEASDNDHDGIPAICDKCPCLTGGLEFYGNDPTENCPNNDRDSDGDGTPNSYDKCPYEFGEPEDDGCPKYSEAELEAIRRINIVKNTGDTSLDLATLQLNRLPSSIRKLNASNIRAIDLSRTSVEDITLLKDFTQLTFLNLSHNRIEDITPLRDMKQLTYLYLNDCWVNDISSLKYLELLRVLDLTDNIITTINPLKNLKQLNKLYLDLNSNLQDISSLWHIKSLEYLSAGGCKISNINVLRNLSLKHLSLAYNRITDISVLSQAYKLEDLDLAGNQITDISKLNGLRQLKYIDLSNNKIKIFNLNLNQFKICPFLDISENPIKNIPKRLTKSAYNCYEIRDYLKKGWLKKIFD